MSKFKEYWMTAMIWILMAAQIHAPMSVLELFQKGACMIFGTAYLLASILSIWRDRK